MNEKEEYVKLATRLHGYNCQESLWRYCLILKSMQNRSWLPIDPRKEFHLIRSIRGVRDIVIKREKLHIYTDPIFMKVPETKNVINLGEYQIVFDKFLETKIRKAKQRKRSSGIMHPFIDDIIDGDYCLGDHREEFENLLQEQNLPTAIQLLIQFLETANNSDNVTIPRLENSPYLLTQSHWEKELLFLEKQRKTRLSSLSRGVLKKERDYYGWRKNIIRELGEGTMKELVSKFYCTFVAHLRKRYYSKKALLKRLSQKDIVVHRCFVKVYSDIMPCVRFHFSGEPEIIGKEIIPLMAKINPYLVVTLAKLVAGFYFQEAAKLVLSVLEQTRKELS